MLFNFNPYKNNGISALNTALSLGVVFFCFAICISLLFQKVLLPLAPSLHAGNGLLFNDSVYFHDVAVRMAENIKLNGWNNWALYPENGARGNVAILGALYALFGHDPTLILPINAFFHALGGIMIYLICYEVSGKSREGLVAGIIASTIFIVLPSTLVWYGQMHKDGYAIAGTLLVLYSWIKALQAPNHLREWFKVCVLHLCGLLLIASVRPYNLTLMLIVTVGLLVYALYQYVSDRQYRTILFVIFSVTSISIIGSLIPDSVSKRDGDDAYVNWQGTAEAPWQWTNTNIIPDKLEHYIESAAKVRAGFIDLGRKVSAGSMIDDHIAPQNVAETLAYLPRAFQISILAPFPSSWLEHRSITRILGAAEMLIYYLTFLGLIYLLFANRNTGTLITLYFASFFLIILAFTNPNLGTLFRYRYPYISLLMMLGVYGWALWFKRHTKLSSYFKQRLLTLPAISSPKTHAIKERKKTLESSLLVMLFTALTFVGFFLRDILMAQKFGLSKETDYFFIALLIPMFVVTVLCIPLGTAFIPFYNQLKNQSKKKFDPQQVIGNLLSWSFISSCCLCGTLFFIGPILISNLLPNGSPSDISDISSLMNLSLLLLLFSSLLIIGNAILNLNNRAPLASIAQLSVPFFAILLLYSFDSQHGAKGVIFGMVIGQLVNLAIVQYFVKDYGISLTPFHRNGEKSKLIDFTTQYWPIVASALFISLTSPIATILAMQLPTGSVSALNLGTKIILFINGLAVAAVTSVILPYFSQLISKNNLSAARLELSFFLAVITVISIPLCLILFTWSDWIVATLFSQGAVDANEKNTVAKVMLLSAIQIPFLMSSAVLLKFYIANKQVIQISIVSFLALLINVIVSIILMSKIQVFGIAVGASISVIFSTVILILMLVYYRYITLLDASKILTHWLIFCTLITCLYFKNSVGIIISILLSLLLLQSKWSEITMFSKDNLDTK